MKVWPITAKCCFSIPPKNIGKPKGFSDVFRGYRKATPGCDELSRQKNHFTFDSMYPSCKRIHFKVDSSSRSFEIQRGMRNYNGSPPNCVCNYIIIILLLSLYFKLAEL